MRKERGKEKDRGGTLTAPWGRLGAPFPSSHAGALHRRNKRFACREEPDKRKKNPRPEGEVKIKKR